MRGYPLFSFRIPTTLAKICFSCLVAQKYLCFSRHHRQEKPDFLGSSRDAQNVCAVAKGGTILKAKPFRKLFRFVKANIVYLSVICFNSDSSSITRDSTPSPRSGITSLTLLSKMASRRAFSNSFLCWARIFSNSW